MRPTFLQRCLGLFYTTYKKKKEYLSPPGRFLLLTFYDTVKPTKVPDDFNHHLDFLIQDARGNPLGKESDIQTFDQEEEDSEAQRENFFTMLNRQIGKLPYSTTDLPLAFQRIDKNKIKVFWKKPWE